MLEIAGQVVTVPLAQLAPLWTGRYLLLWRPQISMPLIGPGHTGEAVRWLAVDWVRASGGSRREGANVLVERLTLDPRTPPSEALIDIYVPID